MRKFFLLLKLVKGLLLFHLVKGYEVSPKAESSSLVASSPRIKQDVAVVASLDGTLYLVDTYTREVKWSFYSGQRIYSSYQAVTVGDDGYTKSNASESDHSNDFHYLDCGDDWELYLHSKRSGNVQKLGLTADEYLRRLPHVWNDGQVTLGMKKTTAYIVDAQTGAVIKYFNLDVTPAYGLPGSNTPLLVANGGDAACSNSWKESQSVIYFTRTDYVLRHYSPNSSEVLWSLAFAEIEAEYRCATSASAFSWIDSSSGEKFGKQWNFPCHMRTTVLRVRDRESFEFGTLPVTQSGFSSKYLLGFDNGSFVPSLPALSFLEKDTEMPLSLPSSGENRLLALPSSASQKIHMLEAPSHRVSENDAFYNLTVLKSFLMYAISAIAAVVSFVWCNFLARRRKQAKLTKAAKELKSPKKKKSRKALINTTAVMKRENDRDSGCENANHEREKRESKLNFYDFADGAADGRRIGKLFVSNKEIAKGSNGTIVLEGVYDGRTVAVKRLVQSHHDVALKEIQNLIASDQHPNVVRWYGVEHDPDFIYIALERCACSLNDFIYAYSEVHLSSSIENLPEKATLLHISLNDYVKMELWKPSGFPSHLLLKLMRDVVHGLAHLHDLGMIHRDVKPQNVLILNDKSISAKLSDMGISKRLTGDVSGCTHNATGCGSSGWQAPEQLLHKRQTRAVDLFSLGCVLFFCITGGKHPFGDSIERDLNIVNDRKDLFLVENIPEAHDLLSALLDHNPESRPKARDVLNHPLFWSPNKKLSFLQDASDRMELENRESSVLLDALERTGTTSFGGRWDVKLEAAFLSDLGRFRRYRFDSVRDLLRVIRNKAHHYRELPEPVQRLLGPLPEGLEAYFSSRFPNLLMEVYVVFRRHCNHEDFFSKYTQSRDF